MILMDDRLAAMIDKVGEPCVIDTVNQKGLFHSISTGLARIYVGDAAVNSALRPIRKAYFKPGITLTDSSEITYRSKEYKVLKIEEVRHINEPLVLMAIIAEVPPPESPGT